MEQKFGPFPLWVWGSGAIAVVALMVIIIQSSQPQPMPATPSAGTAVSAPEVPYGQTAGETMPLTGVDGDQNAAMPVAAPTPTQVTPTPPAQLPVYAGTTLAGKVSPLVEFNQADYEKATAENKLIVLYFYTNYDAAGKAETATALEPVFNQFRDLKVMGFRVNFKDTDTSADEQALAKELGVKKPNTKVLVKGGKILAISTETWDKARYEREISIASVK